LMVDHGDWSPLTTFLACRASSGRPLKTLKITRSGHMCSETVGGIGGMVQEFEIADMAPLCPLGVCAGAYLGPWLI
jgi:hypothetical protein